MSLEPSLIFARVLVEPCASFDAGQRGLECLGVANAGEVAPDFTRGPGDKKTQLAGHQALSELGKQPCST